MNLRKGFSHQYLFIDMISYCCKQKFLYRFIVNGVLSKMLLRVAVYCYFFFCVQHMADAIHTTVQTGKNLNYENVWETRIVWNWGDLIFVNFRCGIWKTIFCCYCFIGANNDLKKVNNPIYELNMISICICNTNENNVNCSLVDI
jgi:hypothetical protein